MNIEFRRQINLKKKIERLGTRLEVIEKSEGLS